MTTLVSTPSPKILQPFYTFFSFIFGFVGKIQEETLKRS